MFLQNFTAQRKMCFRIIEEWVSCILFKGKAFCDFLSWTGALPSQVSCQHSMNLIQYWNHSLVSTFCCVFLLSLFNYWKKLECQMLKACQPIFLIDLIQKADERAFFSQSTFQWLVHYSIMNRKTHLNIPIWISETFQANFILSCAAHTVKK